MQQEVSREERRVNFSELRCKTRGHIQDSVRGIDPSTVIRNEAEMKSQARKLMKNVTPELLLLIKNSLLLGTNFVSAFLEIDGALPKLLRYFYVLGTDPKLQMLASHCLVNLSLGSEEDCLRIVKAAGPYLVMQMEGSNHLNLSLAADSALAVGNLSSHAKVVQLLKEQGAYPRVTKLMMSDSEQVSSAAVYCLTQAVHHYQHLFTSEELLAVVENCLNMKHDNAKVLVLLSLLSNHPAVIDVLKCNLFLTKSLLMLGQQLQTLQKSTKGWTKELKIIVSLVRIIANVIAEPTGEVAAIVLSLPHLYEILSRLPIVGCDIPYLEKESLWLLSNFLNHPSEHVQEICSKMELASLISNYRGSYVMSYLSSTQVSQNN